MVPDTSQSRRRLSLTLNCDYRNLTGPNVGSPIKFSGLEQAIVLKPGLLSRTLNGDVR